MKRVFSRFGRGLQGDAKDDTDLGLRRSSLSPPPESREKHLHNQPLSMEKTEYRDGLLREWAREGGESSRGRRNLSSSGPLSRRRSLSPRLRNSTINMGRDTGKDPSKLLGKGGHIRDPSARTKGGSQPLRGRSYSTLFSGVNQRPLSISPSVSPSRRVEGFRPRLMKRTGSSGPVEVFARGGGTSYRRDESPWRDGSGIGGVELPGWLTPPKRGRVIRGLKQR
ncbi:unnamed protein product [Discosporangium mesarthrocarpum]